MTKSIKSIKLSIEKGMCYANGNEFYVYDLPSCVKEGYINEKLI